MNTLRVLVIALSASIALAEYSNSAPERILPRGFDVPMSSKWGHRGLHKRATGDQSIIGRGYSMYYVLNIDIGTPPQNVPVVVSTTGKSLWVQGPPCNPADAECSGNRRFDMNASSTWVAGTHDVDADGTVDMGTTGRDNVTMGGYTLQLDVGVVEPVGFPDNDAGGINLGLATDYTTTGQEFAKTLWPSPYMGVWAPPSEVSPAARNETYSNPKIMGGNGKITFGGVDASLFSGDIRWMKSSPASFTGSIDGLKVSAESISGRVDGVVFDIGNPSILLPQATVDQLHTAVSGAQKQTDGTWHVPCNTSFQLVVSVTGFDVTLNPTDLLYRYDPQQPTMCLSQIFAATDGIARFGTSFMHNVYTAFDFLTPAVGFAPLVAGIVNGTAPSTTDNNGGGVVTRASMSGLLLVTAAVAAVIL